MCGESSSRFKHPGIKKDCCSFVLFINGIVTMREVKLRLGQECLTLDFVKYWFRLYGCCLGLKLYIILPAPYW